MWKIPSSRFYLWYDFQRLVHRTFLLAKLISCNEESKLRFESALEDDIQSSHGVGPRVIKNWLPLVLGPEFAMDRMPAPVCFRSLLISSSNFDLEITHEVTRSWRWTVEYIDMHYFLDLASRSCTIWLKCHPKLWWLENLNMGINWTILRVELLFQES